MTEKYKMGNIYIKRDDLAGPAFGGNKTRKLEYIMKDALDNGYTAILTVGGPQTNHGRTTVAAARMVGLHPILVLGGDEPEYLSGNLTLDAMMGADIIFAGDHIDDAVKKTIENYEKRGYKVYNLPMGGSTPIGAAGYIMAVSEMLSQIKAMGITPKHVVCPVGSYGMFGGLTLGAKYFNAPFDIIGVPVIPSVQDPKTDATAFINNLSAYYEMGLSFKEDDIRIEFGPKDAPYGGEEYNKPDPLTREYIFELAREEGVILDPTYSGKAFRGMIDMMERDVIPKGDDVLFLHTGGAVAVWTKEHLDDMQGQLRENCSISSL